MAKRNFVAYLENDLLELARQANINISKEFNEYLKSRVGLEIDLSPQTDKKTLEQLISETHNRLISLQTLKKNLEEKAKTLEKNKEDLELKKKMEEAMK